MWCVKLSDSQRDALRALVREGEHGPTLAGALEALELARWDDLPEATLPWERVADLAAGVVVADSHGLHAVLAHGLHAQGVAVHVHHVAALR